MLCSRAAACTHVDFAARALSAAALTAAAFVAAMAAFESGVTLFFLAAGTDFAFSSFRLKDSAHDVRDGTQASCSGHRRGGGATVASLRQA